ncbi:MAG: hypothetical protein U0M60_17365 [Clostridia bacterium]|nr:hypothetical protein [Clostridia bacterium]
MINKALRYRFYSALAIIIVSVMCATWVYADDVIDSIDFESGTDYIQNNASESIGIQNSNGYMKVSADESGNSFGELTTDKSDRLSEALMNILYRDLPDEEYRIGFRFNHTLGAQIDIVPVSDERLGYIRLCDGGGIKIVSGWSNITSSEKISCDTGRWHTLEGLFNPSESTASWYLDGENVAEYSYSASGAIRSMSFQAKATEEIVSNSIPVLLIDEIEAEPLANEFIAEAEINDNRLTLTFSEYPVNFSENSISIKDVPLTCIEKSGKKFVYNGNFGKGKKYDINLQGGITSVFGKNLSKSVLSAEVPPDIPEITITPSKVGGIFNGNREIEFEISAKGEDLSGKASVTSEDGKELWNSGEISISEATKIKPRWKDIENQYGRFYIEVKVKPEKSETYASKKKPFSVVFSNGTINQRMGQSTHYTTRYNALIDDYDNEIGLNVRGGFGINREEFQWDQYEKTAGTYSLTDKQRALLESLSKNRIKPMLILYNASWAYGRESGAEKEFMPMPVTEYQRERYGEYIKNAVTDTKKYDPLYEIGNEWDMGYWNKTHTWSDGTQVTLTVKDHYIPMMKTAYETIKSVNKDAKVIGLAVSAQENALEFIKECIENGAVEYCDMISIHPYSVYESPEEYDIRSVVTSIRTMLSDTAKPDMPIIFSEWGWTSAPGRTSEETQAMYSIRGAALVGDIADYLIWYCAQEKDYIESILEQNFGLINFSRNENAPLAAKPVYIALSCFNSLTGDKEQMAPEVDENGVYKCRFDGEGETVIQFWSTDGDKSIQIPDEGKTALLYDMYGNRKFVEAENGVYSLTAEEKPCYLVFGEDINELSLIADYNTGKVSAFGRTNRTNEYASAIVMKPGATIDDFGSKDKIVYFSQTTTDGAGEYSFDFAVERLSGEYMFYLNSESLNELQSKEFSFKNLIPTMLVESGGAEIKDMSDLSAERDLKVTLSGFDVDDGFVGILAVAQYKNGVLCGLNMEKVLDDTQSFGTEVLLETEVDAETDKIKVFFMNEATQAPLIGSYDIF